MTDNDTTLDTDAAATETGNDESVTTDPAEDVDQTDTPEVTEETFTREYVEGLRRENGKYRQRAQQGDTYAQRLHTELVRATGKLADPTDLPFDETHLDDVESLTTAIDDLLNRKPHLAARRPIGEIGQGVSPSGSSVDLAAILRGKVG